MRRSPAERVPPPVNWMRPTGWRPGSEEKNRIELWISLTRSPTARSHVPAARVSWAPGNARRRLAASASRKGMSSAPAIASVIVSPPLSRVRTNWRLPITCTTISVRPAPIETTASGIWKRGSSTARAKAAVCRSMETGSRSAASSAATSASIESAWAAPTSTRSIGGPSGLATWAITFDERTVSFIENGMTSSALKRTAESSSDGGRSGMSISRMIARSPARPTRTWRLRNRPSCQSRWRASVSCGWSRTSPWTTHPPGRPTWPKFPRTGRRPSSMVSSTARMALVPMSRPMLWCAIRPFRPPGGSRGVARTGGCAALPARRALFVCGRSPAWRRR